MANKEPVEQKSWEEFKSSGLLWFINTILHTFGWAIVLTVEDNKVVNAYPARVTFRGFSEDSNSLGYTRLTKYMKDNANILYNEIKED